MGVLADLILHDFDRLRQLDVFTVSGTAFEVGVGEINPPRTFATGVIFILEIYFVVRNDADLVYISVVGCEISGDRDVDTRAVFQLVDCLHQALYRMTFDRPI